MGSSPLDRRPPQTAPSPRGLRKALVLLERRTKEAIWDCRMRGQCILHSTGMSCPMRCPKNLRNGTQICFNIDKLPLFMARCGELRLLDHVWVLAGVFVASSARGVRYLQVPGVDVPPWVVERMEAVGPKRERDEGVAVALDLVEQIRQIPGISGIHLMTINHVEAIPRVVEGAGLLPRPPTTADPVGGIAPNVRV